MLALGLACWGCSGKPGDGLTKYPVRGTVLVNGEPAAGMVLTFNNLDRGAPGNAARPVGRADPDGHFELSTNGDKDGAVVGDYAVTFFWPSDEGTLPIDLLGGRFADAGRSAFRQRVEPTENDLEPFLLTLDPKARHSPRAKAKGSR
jgi:hypothetical protein